MDEKSDGGIFDAYKLKTVQQNILNVVPHNKEEIQKIASALVKSVLDGDRNSLEVDIALRYLEELVSQIRDNVFLKKEVLAEAEKYPEKTFKAHGAEITKCAVGTRYDYSECKYKYYTDTLEEIKHLNAEKKECEKLLQGLSEDMVIAETGEIVHPPSKTSKEGMRVKLL